MTRFGILLVLALIDLVVAGVLAGWGHRSAAFLFLLMAVLMGGYALFSSPTQTRDSSGRLKSAEFPYAGVLGVVGAMAILVSAGYVAWNSSRPRPADMPQPTRVTSAPIVVPAIPEPSRDSRAEVGSAVIYKCVDASGHESYQSQPCATGARQAWVRDATPEPTAPRAQRRRAASSTNIQESNTARGSFGGYADSGSRSTNPGSSVACRSARAADAAYRDQPLRYVTHDGLRRHGDNIRRACN